MPNATGIFRDRDYVETVEGFYFCVLGYVHPSNRVLAYLKYKPSGHGPWRKGSQKYTRAFNQYTVKNIAATISHLKREYPQYVIDDPTIKTQFSAVPTSLVKKHLQPQPRLRGMIAATQRDELEEEAVELVNVLAGEAGVDSSCFGVTGSLLMGIHDPKHSDIDLTVYGREEAVRVKEALKRLYQTGARSVRKLSGPMLEEWCRVKAQNYPLTTEEAATIYSRTWSRALFRGRLFSVHPVKKQEEIHEKYGSSTYEPIDAVEIEATVSDASNALFLPSTYTTQDATVHPHNAVVTDLVTYEGLYTDILHVGERVKIRGLLERVITQANGAVHHRILVGSMRLQGLDFIKPARAASSAR
ncbi:MAG: hypothetical protein ACE5PO_03580 [Candidatus Bathyarchaeia archaeon]